MIPSQKYRLTTEDVRFLVRKRRVLFSRSLLLMWYPQRSEVKYHQYSVNIGLVYSKSAVERKFLKRLFLSVITPYMSKKTQRPYYKLFVSLNKKNVEYIQDMRQDISTKEFSSAVRSLVSKEFSHLMTQMMTKTRRRKKTRNNRYS